MATLRQANNTDIDSGFINIYSLGGIDWWATQTFTTSAAYTISAVKLLIHRVGTPGTITVGIRAVDGNSKPTGADLSSGTVDGDTLTTDLVGEWKEINLGNYALSASTEYAIVVRALAGDGSNYVNWNTGRNSYEESWTSLNGGSTWGTTTIGTSDFGIETYSPGYVSPDSNVTKQIVITSLNEVWYGTTAEVITQVAASVGGINVEAYSLTIYEAYGKAFIVNGTIKKVVDFTNYKLQTDDIKDTVAGATSYPLHGVTVTGAGGAAMIIDYITAIDGSAVIYGKKTNTTAFVDGELVSGTNSDGTVVKFDIKSGTTEVDPDPPHFYDWTVYGNSSVYGAMPTKATAGCNWRGRAIITKDEDNPHQWYMPRQGNPWDWEYVVNDAGSPVAGGNSPQAGQIGDDVITVIPYSKDYLVFICATSLWYAAGDPAEGGSILPYDDTAGGLGATCWCKDKEGNLFIVATSGILKIPKGFGPSENLTEIHYPDFIKDLAYTPGTHTLVVSYDRKRHGINIFKTTIADGTITGWWFDLRTQGLFPESYPEECGVFSAFYYEATDPDYRVLLFGCNDGHIRFHDDTAVDDDIGVSDEAIDSYVTFGPIAMGGENKEGSFTSMNIVSVGGASGGSESDSNDIDFKIWTGLAADDISEKLIANVSPQIAGTVTAPGRRRGSAIRRKVRGAYLGLRIGNDTTAETWGMEKVIIDLKGGGRIK